MATNRVTLIIALAVVAVAVQWWLRYPGALLPLLSLSSSNARLPPPRTPASDAAHFAARDGVAAPRRRRGHDAVDIITWHPRLPKPCSGHGCTVTHPFADTIMDMDAPIVVRGSEYAEAALGGAQFAVVDDDDDDVARVRRLINAGDAFNATACRGTGAPMTFPPASLEYHYVGRHGDPVSTLHNPHAPLARIPGVNWTLGYPRAKTASLANFFDVDARRAHDDEAPPLHRMLLLTLFDNADPEGADLTCHARGVRSLGFLERTALLGLRRSAHDTPREVLQVNLWASSPGYTTPAHYDLPHNFYLQVAGAKRFVLFPPRDLAPRGLRPKTHPADRMLDRRVGGDTDGDRRGEITAHSPPQHHSSSNPRSSTSNTLARPREALLRAGDLLYIPPHWGHRVESLGWSVSVSAHVESAAVAARERVQALALPFDLRAEERYRIAALRQFIPGLFGWPGDDDEQARGSSSRYVDFFFFFFFFFFSNSHFYFFLKKHFHFHTAPRRTSSRASLWRGCGASGGRRCATTAGKGLLGSRPRWRLRQGSFGGSAPLCRGPRPR
jgi:hypothetical protein